MYTKTTTTHLHTHTFFYLCVFLHWWQRVSWDFSNKADSAHLSNIPPFAPPLEKFLGRQVYSYGQLLSITFTSETPELLPNHVTVFLQGSGITVSADLSPQPVLDYDLGLTPRNYWIVRYKDAGMLLSVCESVHVFVCISFLFFPLLLLNSSLCGKYQSICLSVCIRMSSC